MARKGKRQNRRSAVALAREAAERAAIAAEREAAEARRVEALQRYELLKRFFGTAGIAVQVSSGGWIKVNAQRVSHLDALTIENDWDGFVDRVAAVCCSREFIATLRRNLSTAHAHAFYDRTLHGFRIEKRSRDVALVCATAGVVWGDYETTPGNYLVDGIHWDRFRRNFEAAAETPFVAQEPERRAPTRSRYEQKPRFRFHPPALLTVIREPPTDIPPELVDDALEASRRIRQERRLVYSHEVLLHYRDGDLRLFPLYTGDPTLSIPYSFTRVNGARDVRGSIDLTPNQDRDPIAVSLDTEAAGSLLGRIWASALLGFADVSCLQLDTPIKTASSRGLGGGAASHPRRTLGTTPHAPRTIWPSSLSPVGPWAAHTASYVAGHVRRLSDGRVASSEAIRSAREVGLTLGPSETYVRPHARGLPDTARLEFEWRCPRALLLGRN